MFFNQVFHSSVESTALRLISGLGPSEVQPHLSKFNILELLSLLILKNRFIEIDSLPLTLADTQSAETECFTQSPSLNTTETRALWG